MVVQTFDIVTVVVAFVSVACIVIVVPLLAFFRLVIVVANVIIVAALPVRNVSPCDMVCVIIPIALDVSAVVVVDGVLMMSFIVFIADEVSRAVDMVIAVVVTVNVVFVVEEAFVIMANGIFELIVVGKPSDIAPIISRVLVTVSLIGIIVLFIGTGFIVRIIVPVLLLAVVMVNGFVVFVALDDVVASVDNVVFIDDMTDLVLADNDVVVVVGVVVVIPVAVIVVIAFIAKNRANNGIHSAIY